MIRDELNRLSELSLRQKLYVLFLYMVFLVFFWDIIGIALLYPIESKASVEYHSLELKPVIIVVSKQVDGRYVAKAAYLPSNECISKIDPSILDQPHRFVEEPYVGWKPCSPL